MSSTKPTNPLVALVDCNNFYVSCERVFNPKLIDKPVVVLSNNDGCVIARSKEAKKLGIPMGVPVFQIKDLLKKQSVIACSSNYTLYGDMSHRVMQTLQLFTSTVQIYSIDEAFLSLDTPTAETNCVTARQIILQHTGIPVSIGIGATKTLAKIANHVAKNDPSCEGIFFMGHPLIHEVTLRQLPVEEIWGIGRQISQFLYHHGIKTAWDLCHLDDAWIRKHLTVVVLRTAWELRGISCLELEEVPSPKKSIVSSKSFGCAVTQWEELAEAVSTYTARAAEKLRRQKSLASHLGVFVESRDYEKGNYSNQISMELPQPTAYTPTLIQYAKLLLRKIFLPGFKYRKAGIFLEGLVPEGCFQLDLFVEKPHEKQQALMKLIDRTNMDFGKKVIRLAAEGTSQPWKMKQLSKSPRFTTRWNELLSIRI